MKKLKMLAVLAFAAAVVAVPLEAEASAYSSLTMTGIWWPPGYSHGFLCGQSAIIDTARNYNQAVSMYESGSGRCDGGNQGVPSGYLGTQVAGYRDGAWCGTSSVYYSTTFTSAWQLWITMCTNPAGTQAFNSYGYSYGWVGSGYQMGGVLSPSQNY